jgi:Type III restriction enzyme, res subunit
MKTIIYIWEDTKRPGYLKFGDHVIAGRPSKAKIERDTKKYIRGSLSRMKGFMGEIDIHLIQDITDYAVSVGRCYEHAKIDDYICNNSDLRLHRVHGDFYKIDLDGMKKYINQVIHGTKAIGNYKSHKFQSVAITKATDYFTQSSTNTDFLLDCVMRFGKCFTSYKIAKNINANRILVVTGRPKVKDGWLNDLDHVDFPNWEFIDSQTVDNVEFTNNGNTQVIFASFQGSDRLDSRLDRVLQQDIDLVIIDEAHAYFSTDAIKFVKETLNTTHRLWVSGTPFKAYESGMFDGETDTYRFTLVDLLREKQAVEAKIKAGVAVADDDLRFTEFPEIQFLVAEYPHLGDKVSNEEGLNMKALLSSRDGVSNYPDEVKGLLDSLLDPTRRSSPFNLGGREIKYPVKPEHIWMAVPAGRDETKELSVAAASVLAEGIEQHPILGAKYAPLAIKGDKTQDDVNSHIMLSSIDKKGTINISCRSLNTGTKFPDLDTVVFLNETSSAAEFWQTVGRALQPKPGKKHITIMLYSIEMAVTMANKMVEYSIHPGQTHNQLMTEFLSMMPIYVQGGPKLHSLTIDEVYQELSTRGSVEKAFGDREVLSANFDSIVLNDPSFFDSIPDVNSDKAPNQVNLGQGGKGKNASLTKLTPSSSKAKDAIKDARQKVQEFLRCTGSVMAASLLYDQHLIKSTQDLAGINADTMDAELYPGTKDIITYLINAGAINANVLDRKIGAFYNVELKDKV